MKRVFIDANVILRLLTKDDEGQFKKAEKLFSKAINGDVMLVCGPPVLFEVAWTLEARYKIPNMRILDYLESLLATDGIEIVDRHLVEKAISKSRISSVEFADAYIASIAEDNSCQEIAIFNISDFKKLKMNLHEIEK